MDDTLRTMFQDLQSGIRSFVRSVFKQVMLDRSTQGINWKVVTCTNIEANVFRHLCSWWGAVKEAIDLKNNHGTYCDICRTKEKYCFEGSNYCTTFATMGPIDTVETFEDVVDSLVSRPYSGTVQPPPRMSSKCCLTHFYRKRNVKDIEQQ